MITDRAALALAVIAFWFAVATGALATSPLWSIVLLLVAAGTFNTQRERVEIILYDDEEEELPTHSLNLAASFTLLTALLLSGHWAAAATTIACLGAALAAGQQQGES
jgi:hypothetical protein